jgi:TonB family protein
MDSAALTKTFSKTKVPGVTIAASIAVHAIVAVFALVAYRSFAGEAAPPALDAPAAPRVGAGLALELPAVGASSPADEMPIDPVGDPPRLTAGAEVAHLDTGAPGRGGQPTERDPALNLADLDEQMRVSPDLMNRLDRDQLQRLRASRARASWEDRRATVHPAELTLVVMGKGMVVERRPDAASRPSRGAMRSPASSVTGAALGAPPDVEDSEGPAPQPVGGERRGSLDGAPGLGLVDGRAGVDHRAAAPIASARPAVTYGPVAMPAVVRARPTDDVDGEQEVATAVRSLVHASTAGGWAGEGSGGSEGGGEAGAGGAHLAGSRATPLGLGPGDVFDYWTTDPRLLPYFRQLHGRIDPLWADAFPKSALLELKQGTVILEFTVFADGHVTVAWPPVRPSGIDEFDRNCADAIRRAAPFPPIPAQLGTSELRVRAPFIASNPIVK